MNLDEIKNIITRDIQMGSANDNLSTTTVALYVRQVLKLYKAGAIERHHRLVGGELARGRLRRHGLPRGFERDARGSTDSIMPRRPAYSAVNASIMPR